MEVAKFTHFQSDLVIGLSNSSCPRLPPNRMMKTVGFYTWGYILASTKMLLSKNRIGEIVTPLDFIVTDFQIEKLLKKAEFDNFLGLRVLTLES